MEGIKEQKGAKIMKFDLYEMMNSSGKINSIEIIIPHEAKISDVVLGMNQIMGHWVGRKLIKTMTLKETIDNYDIDKVLLSIEDIGYCVIVGKEKTKKIFEIKKDVILSMIHDLEETIGSWSTTKNL